MIFVLLVLMTVSALVVVGACFAARTDSPVPHSLEKSRTKGKAREELAA